MSTTDNDELENEVQQLRDEVERLKQEREAAYAHRIKPENQNDGAEAVSRRTFLKGLAGGAVGLGGLGLLGNATGYDITSSHPFTLYNATEQKNFEVDTQGVLTTNQIGTSGNPVSDIYSDTISADSQLGNYTTLATSTSDLESAFTNASAGDTIAVAQPDTPYRISQWLDINVSDVTVQCESAYARNGEPLVKVADGANVGGIRVGTNSHVENIIIEGYGHHGNDQNQDSTVKRCHGIVVEDAMDVTIRNCAFTRTHPYHEHNDGGSGISVRHHASEVNIENNYCYDVGDRGIQVAGDNITIYGNKSVDGYDRAVSMNVAEPDGIQYMARGVTVVSNVGRDHSTGSIIGVGSTAEFDNAMRTGIGNYVIANNVALGEHRRVVTIRGPVGNVAVVGNVDYKDGTEPAPGIDVKANGKHFLIANNLVKNSVEDGIYLDVMGYTCTGNVVDSPSENGIETVGSEGTVTGNAIRDAGANGIRSESGATAITGNFIRNSGDHNILMASVATPSTLGFNAVGSANQNGSGSDEICIEDSRLLVMGNRIYSRAGPFAFAEAAGADKNLYVGNRSGETIANMFDINGAESWGYANFPALADAEESVTLTGGASPAARIDGISTNEAMDFDVHVQPDPASSQPTAAYAWDAYTEWDDTNGQWDLVVSWRTDPGSGNDVAALYEVTRQPTSRGIKN